MKHVGIQETYCRKSEILKHISKPEILEIKAEGIQETYPTLQNQEIGNSFGVKFMARNSRNVLLLEIWKLRIRHLKSNPPHGNLKPTGH